MKLVRRIKQSRQHWVLLNRMGMASKILQAPIAWAQHRLLQSLLAQC